MKVKINIPDNIDEQIWYADKQGEEFQMITYNSTHYIVFMPHEGEHLLMGVLREHGELIEDDGDGTPDSDTRG